MNALNRKGRSVIDPKYTTWILQHEHWTVRVVSHRDRSGSPGGIQGFPERDQSGAADFPVWDSPLRVKAPKS